MSPACAGRSPAGASSATDSRSASISASTASCGTSTSARGDLERRPVDELRERLHLDRRDEAPRFVGRVGKLELVLRVGDRAHATPRRGAPEPAPDVAVDRLRVDALLAEPRDEHRRRDLPLAEAGDLDALGQIRHRVLDGVLHLVGRDVDRQAHAVLAEVLYGRGHWAIQPAAGRVRSVERYDVVVVGVGGMGSAALYHLARRGKRVLGLERFDLLHEQGSSHGLTRIIRLAYFEHPDYVPLLRRAYELWRELEAEAGEQLLHVTGIVEGGDRILDGVLRSCAEHDLAHEVLNGAEVAERFPAYRLPPAMDVVHQPDGGFVVPERCIVAHVEGALARGATLRARERVLEWERDRERRPRPHGSRRRRGRAPRPHRRRLVAGRRAATGRARPGCPPVPRLAPADAARALRARPDARLQSRARRRALLRLPGARHPRLQARSLRPLRSRR